MIMTFAFFRRLHEHVHLPALTQPQFMTVIQHYMRMYNISFSDSAMQEIDSKILANTHICSPMLTGALAEAIVKEGVLGCIYRSIQAFEQAGDYGEDPVSVQDLLLKVDKFYPPLALPPQTSHGSSAPAFEFDAKGGEVTFHIGV